MLWSSSSSRSCSLLSDSCSGVTGGYRYVGVGAGCRWSPSHSIPVPKAQRLCTSRACKLRQLEQRLYARSTGGLHRQRSCGPSTRRSRPLQRLPAEPWRPEPRATPPGPAHIRASIFLCFHACRACGRAHKTWHACKRRDAKVCIICEEAVHREQKRERARHVRVWWHTSSRAAGGKCGGNSYLTEEL